MRAHDLDLVDALCRLASAVTGQRHEDAATAADTIRFEVPQRAKRPPLPPRVIAEVYVRDRFTCRYCGTPTIPQPVLRCISGLFPVEFPFHPNGKTTECHTAYWLICSAPDHVSAGSTGGDWLDPNNLVCSCWPCNGTKSNTSLDHLGWSLTDITDSVWDGLTGNYRALWNAAGQPDSNYHRPWLNAWAKEA